ncbi:MAG: hypothetical protein WBG92_02650 [Thiohalocapsa sp.]
MNVHLLSILVAFSAGIAAMSELALMHARSIDAYRVLIRWQNLFVFTLAAGPANPWVHLANLAPVLIVIYVDAPIFAGLAVSLLFGLLVSTVLTLVVIPVVYCGVMRKWVE